MIRLHIILGPSRELLDQELRIQETYGWTKIQEYTWKSVEQTFYAYQLINIRQPK